MGKRPNILKLDKSSQFPGISSFQISNFQIPEKVEIWNSDFKIKLSDLNWVGKIPNILKLAKTSQFLRIWRFPISRFQIPEKLEIWNSEFKIKRSDVNWVGKICNILKLAKTTQFLGISRFPDFQFPDSRNIGNFKLWVQNQAQWCKMSGKNMQHIEIGQY